jgi:hypothetical protein
MAIPGISGAGASHSLLAQLGSTVTHGVRKALTPLGAASTKTVGDPVAVPAGQRPGVVKAPVNVRTPGLNLIEAAVQQAAPATDPRSGLVKVPLTHHEAVVQRQDLVSKATNSDLSLGQLTTMIADPAADPAVIHAFGLERDTNKAAWEAVPVAFAHEFRLASGRKDSPLDGSDPAFAVANQPDNYIASLDFDPAFRDKIVFHARLGAQLDVTPIDAAVLEELEHDYVAPIIDRLQAGDTGGAITLLEDVEDMLLSDPLVTRTDGTLDPYAAQVMSEWLYGEALVPVYQQVAGQAPSWLDLTARNSDRGERAQNVTAEMLRLAQVLPGEDAAGAVLASKGIWQPVIEDDLMAAITEPGGQGFDDAVGDFNETFDIVARAPNGEEALGAMGDSFVAAWGSPAASTTPNSDILASALGDAVGEGRGGHLAVELIGRFQRDNALDGLVMIDHLGRGIQVMHENGLEHLNTAAFEQEQLLNIIGEFASLAAPVAPGELDLPALELELALRKYLDSTDQAAVHAALAVDADALNYKHLVEALSGLSLDNETVSAPIDAAVGLFTAEEQESGLSLHGFYASNPAVQGAIVEDHRTVADVLELRDDDAWRAGLPLGPNDGAAWLLDPQTHAVPRNLRFAANTLRDPTYGIPALKGTPWPGGVTMFGLAALQGADATVKSFDAGKPWDAAISGTRTLSFGTLSHISSSYPYSPIARSAMRTAAFGELLVADAIQLVKNHREGADTAQWVIDSVSFGGSAAITSFAGADLLLKNGVGIAADGSKTQLGTRLLGATRLGGVGGIIYVATALARYQKSRVDASNRFETAEQRQALSFIGSLGPDGSLKPVFETSTFEDHDVKVGPPRWRGEGRIEYRGLSAEAVDALLNSNGDSRSPHNAIEGIAAFAEAKGVAPRDLLLAWGGPDAEVSPTQFEAFAVAALDVDPRNSGVCDDFVWSRWRARMSDMSGFIGGKAADITPAEAKALLDYLDSSGVYSAGTGWDMDKLGVLLGTRQPGAADQVPPESTRAIAIDVVSSMNDSPGIMPPQSADELELWLEWQGGYPEVRAPIRGSGVYGGDPNSITADQLGPLPDLTPPGATSPRPAGEAAAPNVDSDPLLTQPFVAVDGSIEDFSNFGEIAESVAVSRFGADASTEEFLRTLDHLYELNPQFDRSRADGRLTRTPGEATRDPDLILDGEEIRIN